MIRKFLLLARCAVLLSLAGGVHAAIIATGSEVLAANAALTQQLPPARSFTVTTAGQVEVRLTDLVATAAFTSLQLVIAQGDTRILRLDAAGTAQFAAQPGTYRVHVVGTAAAQSAGTFNVEVRMVAGGAVLLQYTDGMVGSPAATNPAQSLLDTSFAISQPGDYQITLTDRAFPVALASINLILLRQDGGASPVMMSAAGTSPVFNVASAGNYDLLVAATGAGADQAGLYSVVISGGPTSTAVYESTQPVGRLPAPTALTLAAGTTTIVLTDFAIPAALSLVQAVLVQGATALPVADVGTTVVLASAGTAQLFAFARAATSAGAGSYGLKLSQGTQTLLADARALPAGFDAAAGVGAYSYTTNVTTAGGYELQLRDYAFPIAFTSLRAAISQGGVLTQSLTAAGNVTANLMAGPAIVLVIGRPPSSSSNSLFGIGLVPQPTGAALLATAQGVGGLFATRNFTVATAGSYDVATADLEFPSRFTEFAVAVTQGTSLIGQVFGGGQFTINNASGDYSLNVLARLGSGINFGSWGFEVANTPPAPVVTLSANPATLTTQQTTVLQWSSTDATSCTASGAWSGSKSVTGTETVGPFSTDTTFTLSCTGPGGNSSRALTVTVTPASASKSGGGGAFGAELLLLLLLLVLARYQRTISSNTQPAMMRYQAKSVKR